MEIKPSTILAVAVVAAVGYLTYKAANKWFSSQEQTSTTTPSAASLFDGPPKIDVTGFLAKVEDKFLNNAGNKTFLDLFKDFKLPSFNFSTTKTTPTEKTVLATIPYSGEDTSYNPNLFGGGLKYINQQAKEKTVKDFYAGLLPINKIMPVPSVKPINSNSKSSKTITKAEAPKNNNWSIGAPTVPSGKYGGGVYVG